MFTGNIFIKDDEEFGKKATPDAIQLGNLVSALKESAGLASLTKTFELPYGGIVEVVDDQHVSYLTIWPPDVVETTRVAQPREAEESTEGEFLFGPPIKQSWKEGAGFINTWGEEATIFDAMPLAISTEGKLLGGNGYVAGKYGGGYSNDVGNDKSWLPSSSEFVGYKMHRGENPMHTFYIPVPHTWTSRGITSYSQLDFELSYGVDPQTSVSVTFAANVFWNGVPVWAAHAGVPGTFLAGACYYKAGGKLIVVVQNAEIPDTQWLLSYNIVMPTVSGARITGQPIVNLNSMEILDTWDAKYDASTPLTDVSYAIGSTVYWTFSPDGSKAVKQLIVYGSQRADITGYEILQQVEELSISSDGQGGPTTGAYSKLPIVTLCADAYAGDNSAAPPYTDSGLSEDRFPMRLGYTAAGDRCEFGVYASKTQLDNVDRVAEVEFKAYYKTPTELYLPDLVVAEIHGMARSRAGYTGDFNLTKVSTATGWIFGTPLGNHPQQLGAVTALPCVDLRTGTMVASVSTMAAHVVDSHLPPNQGVTTFTVENMRKDLFLILNKDGVSTVYTVPRPPRNPPTCNVYEAPNITKVDEFRLGVTIDHEPIARFYSFANTYDGTMQVADDGAIAFSAVTTPMTNNTLPAFYDAGVGWYTHGWDTFIAVPDTPGEGIPASFEFKWLPDISAVDMSGLDSSYQASEYSVYRFLGYLQYANLNDTEGL